MIYIILENKINYTRAIREVCGLVALCHCYAGRGRDLCQVVVVGVT